MIWTVGLLLLAALIFLLLEIKLMSVITDLTAAVDKVNTSADALIAASNNTFPAADVVAATSKLNAVAGKMDAQTAVLGQAPTP